jgi:hypothetical protein
VFVKIVKERNECFGAKSWRPRFVEEQHDHVSAALADEPTIELYAHFVGRLLTGRITQGAPNINQRVRPIC